MHLAEEGPLPIEFIESYYFGGSTGERLRASREIGRKMDLWRVIVSLRANLAVFLIPTRSTPRVLSDVPLYLVFANVSMVAIGPSL